jgi:hypothetical protein
VTARDPISDYVARIGAEVGHHRLRRRFLREIETHLRDAVEARIAAGAGREQAFSQAVDVLGQPSHIAAALTREIPQPHPPRRWAAIAACTTAAIVVMAAIGLATSPPRQGSEQAIDKTIPHVSAAARDVAAALHLSPESTAALSRAQALGREATACLLAHGGRSVAGGGIADPNGQAAAACRAIVDANEAYLASAAFAQVIAEAEPRFEAAERCYAAHARVVDSATADGSFSAVSARTPHSCSRGDGLPSPMSSRLYGSA